MSRAMELASLPIRAERARARLFPPSKWAGLFPSAAYRRSAPPPREWGWSAALAGWAVTARHGRFSRGAGQRVWETASAGGASREARCRAAALGTKAPETRGPLPSVSKAQYLAVQPPRLKARVGCRGTAPAERRHWGRKRRKREALCRAFPKRHTYLYSPRAKGAEWGAGALPLPARRFFLWMGI